MIGILVNDIFFYIFAIFFSWTPFSNYLTESLKCLTKHTTLLKIELKAIIFLLSPDRQCHVFRPPVNLDEASHVGLDH